MKLVYSDEAIDDLVRLRGFIARKDAGAAARVGAALVTRIERLREFPQMGVAVEQALPPANIRDMVFGNYVVRDSVHEGAFAILRIWHHYEDRSTAAE